MLEVFPTEFGFAFKGHVEGDEWLQHDGSPVVKFKSAVANRAYGESRPEVSPTGTSRRGMSLLLVIIIV